MTYLFHLSQSIRNSIRKTINNIINMARTYHKNTEMTTKGVNNLNKWKIEN